MIGNRLLEMVLISLPQKRTGALPESMQSFLILVRRAVFLLLPFVVIFTTNSSTYNEHHVFRRTGLSRIPMLQYLPEDYHSNSDKYPLVIFLHGIIEKGVSSSNLLIQESTIHTVDNVGPPKQVKLGHGFPFILLSPQLRNVHETWPDWYVVEVIEWAKENLRVDEKSIHITGLSLGGGGVFSVIEKHPELFASASPICAFTNEKERACDIAKEDLSIWAFHGDADPQVPLSTTYDMVRAVNACAPERSDRARVTIYPGLRHNAWDIAYFTDHTYHSPNLYEWMMQTKNVRTGKNYLPVADAGSDVRMGVPGDMTLTGAGHDQDGKVVHYHWSMISGKGVVIDGKSGASCKVRLKREGNYMMKLTVKDNEGATDSDYVRITVGD
jgi:hypothetical protein